MLHLRRVAAWQAHRERRQERRLLNAATEATVDLIAAVCHFQKETDEVKTEAAQKVSTSVLLVTNVESLVLMHQHAAKGSAATNVIE